MSKSSKVIVSSRVYPDVKFELDEEAEATGITTSKYLEQIIENRFDVPDDDESDNSDDVAELETKIDELETANKNMSSQLDAYEEEYDALKEELKMYQESPSKPDSNFPINLGEDESEQLKRLLNKLRKLHPGVPNNLLLLGALDTTLRTENAIWMIPKINKFINRQKRVS